MGRDSGGTRQERAKRGLSPRALQKDRRRERDEIRQRGAQAEDHRGDAARRRPDDRRGEGGDERQAERDRAHGCRDHAVPGDALRQTRLPYQDESRVRAETDEVDERQDDDDRQSRREHDELQEADDDGCYARDEPAETDAEQERADAGEVVDQPKLQVRKREQEDRRHESESRRNLRPKECRDLALRDHEGEGAEEDGRVDTRPRTLAQSCAQSAHEDHKEERVRN